VRATNFEERAIAPTDLKRLMPSIKNLNAFILLFY
jgi:hypothetical protein